MRLFRPMPDLMSNQRGHLFVWSPVCLAIGIGLYFGLKDEFSAAGFGLLLVSLTGLGLRLYWADERISPVLGAVALLITGVLVAALRVYLVAEPVLGFRYYGPIEGRVVVIDRSAKGALRLTLDRVRLENTSARRTPAKIRVTLQGQQGGVTPQLDQTVILTGNLSPPPGAAEPGGFDFQRYAWFRGLGAVGYTRTPVLRLAPAESRPGRFLPRLRMRISRAVQAELGGENGAFAAAVLTGDRSGMSRATIAELRASNLAHLLAISGLHMGMLTGFIFAALRYGLALVPWLALRWPLKKIAAGGALLGGAAYLALSGGIVATERAFVMVGVMLLAVFLDRRAITLRAVALAALIVLLRRPESLVEPGFQMSFAATTVLVAVFGRVKTGNGGRFRRIARPVVTLILSSAVAGAATAPFAAATFNQIAQYGLLANLLTVPVMGVVVMPAAVLTALLFPFGLSGVGLWAMGAGIDWILTVAQWVAGFDGAVVRIVTPGTEVLPMLALGGLWVIQWQGWARMIGLMPVGLALFLWSATQRPDLLVSPSGKLIGVMAAQGRALNKPRGEGFVALSWLENDGDAATQKDGFARPGFFGDPKASRFFLAGIEFLHLTGKGAQDRVPDSCGENQWILLAADAPMRSACNIIDRRFLQESGALALYQTDDGLRLVTAARRAGRRPWNSQ